MVAENGIAPSTGASPILMLVIKPVNVHVVALVVGNVITQASLERLFVSASIACCPVVSVWSKYPSMPTSPASIRPGRNSL